MSSNVGHDQLAIIRIEGMHCRKCEQAIQRALTAHPDVHEVEVDFASGQASVLFRKGELTVKDLMQTVEDTGYRATGVSQRSADPAQA